MSTSLVTAEHAAYTDEQRRLITDVLCKGATPVEVEFFMQVAQRCRLDPFRRQIHAVKRWDSQTQRETLTFQVGIDGLRAIAARTGEYAGNDDPVFEVPRDSWHPVKATVTVYRMVHGQRIPFTASVFWAEYVQTKRGGEVTNMWRQRPFGQLGKCAEAAALRKAFPEESGGLYTEEELRDDTSFIQPAQAQAMPISAEVELKASAPAADLEVESPGAQSNSLLDLLTVVSDTTGPDDLCKWIGEAERLVNLAETKTAKRAIAHRAKELGLQWDAATSTFIAG